VKRLAFASMTYGPVDPAIQPSLRVATWHAQRHGNVVWVGDMSPNRMKFDVARNLIAQTVCNETDADYIFWCDSDIILQQDAISRLVSHDLDFVTGLYFQRPAPHWPLVASKLPGENGSFQWIVKWPLGALFPADGCGFGCVLTSTKMLKAMKKDWFTYEKFSEDFDFCIKARRAGFQLMVDSSVLCGHLPDPEPVTFETYKAAHPEIVWPTKREAI
jgi:hypothetical protein